MLDVGLFGGVSFSVGSRIVRPELGPSGRLLACYLFAFMGRTHRRERLADLFWHELDPEKSRSALNTAIWRIRKMLDAGIGAGKLLVTVGDDIILERTALIKVDTHALETAARSVSMLHKNIDASDEDGIMSAVDSYLGPFLDGEDCDWVLQERERLHALFVRTALSLMRAAAGRGDYERALDFARRIVASDPLRESVQRNLMVLLVLNGQRAEAIRTYDALKALLKADLAIEPMPDTKHLRNEIISGTIFQHLDTHVATILNPAAVRRPPVAVIAP